MNIIFCHLSTFNLQYFHKKSVLFDDFMESTFFEIALTSYIQALSINKIVLIFPENDQNFIKEKLNNLNLNNSKIILFPLTNDDPYAFNENNIQFNPQAMTNVLTFGAWNFPFIESQARKISLTKFIILNLEDFWFLKAKDLNQIFNLTNTLNFSFKSKNGGYHLLAGSFKEAKINFARNVNSKTRSIKQLKENFNNLTSLSKLDAHSGINLKREKNLDTHIQFVPKITDIIDRNAKPDKTVSILIKDILQNPLALSLSSNFGIRNLQQFNQLTKTCTPLSNNKNYEKLFFSKPKVMRIQLQNRHNSISLKDFKNAIDILPEVNFLIFEGYDQLTEDRLVKMLKYATLNLTSHIYIESSCVNLNTKMLNKLFSKGVSVCIIDIDSFLLKKSAFELEKQIETLLEIKEKHVNKYIMLKKKNILDDSDYIPLLIHRWQYLVDGIMITRSENPDEAYKTSTNQKQCSIIPYEIYLKSNAKLALCKNMLEKEFSLSNYASWLEQAEVAPDFEKCQNCLDKNRYMYRSPFNLSKKETQKYLFKLQTNNTLSLIQLQINKKDYLQALICTEEILKINPTNQTAWELLTQIENNLKS